MVAEMKKTLSFVLLFTLFVCGCKQDESLKDQSAHLDLPIVTAGFEQNESRTYIEEGNLLRWTKNDQISFFFKYTFNFQYQFEGNTGDNAGTFSPVKQVVATGMELQRNYAIYPYASNTKITENGVITATLPSEQNYAPNSFGLGDNTMVAATEDIDDTFLKFKNVGGYLKLLLYGDNVTVKTITLQGNSNEKLAGTATITPSYNGDPTIAMADDATKVLTLDCGENGVEIGSTQETATVFWIVVPPTTFTSGFTITITDVNGNEFTKSTSKNIEIERNVIQPMSAINVECEKELASNYSNGIAYVANAGELSSIIPDNEKNVITSLKISGYLNGDDIIYIRQMLGGSEFSNEEKGKLISLDLSEASIVEGGEWYYESYSSSHYYTSNDAIGQYMFHQCANLKNIVLPNGITSIGNNAFWGCPSLASIEIPDGVTSIGQFAFSNCSSLTSVTMGIGVTSIVSYAFSNCSSLVSINIPNGVTSIAESTFYNCSSLTSIDIPDNVISIGFEAFWGCSSLTSVTIGTGVTKIDGCAFSACSSLASVDIPNSVTSIGFEAFSNCTSLVSVTMGNSITSIGDYAFNNCPSLKSVQISDLSAWCKITFIDAGSNPLSNGAKLYLSNQVLTELIIPEGITEIKDNAFFDYSFLTSVIIGNGVTSIGESAFTGCSSLTSVTIGDDVTSIGGQAFWMCSSLTSVTMGYGVTSIGSRAFSDCSSLISIDIPDGVTSIDGYAFSGCSSLISIDIPDGVTSISYEAFSGCSSLVSVTIGNGVTSIGKQSFKGCSSLTDLYCYATTPPILEYYYVNNYYSLPPFPSYGEKTTLHVPAQCDTKYKSSDWGTYFINIKGMD